jgi:hypothetical protein
MTTQTPPTASEEDSAKLHLAQQALLRSTKDLDWFEVAELAFKLERALFYDSGAIRSATDLFDHIIKHYESD